MGIDILEVAKRLWPNVADAEGIVLLDEIGSHLHPVWKMTVVNSLRAAFPGFQFVTTTHEPLCLRGLDEGEVVIMQRDEGLKIRAMTGLPSPSALRVDQLLTSEFFGLNSTRDAETEKVFDEYYGLMALPKRNREQSNRLDELKVELKDRSLLGNTLREQLMYEVIDRLVAEGKVKIQTIPDLAPAAVAEIKKVWEEKTASSRRTP